MPSARGSRAMRRAPDASEVDSPSRVVFREQFYKTELCHFFQHGGGCVKGNGCCYAHGEEELRIAPDLTKTSLCPAWVARRCSLSSDVCPFAHGWGEMRVTPAFREYGARQSAAARRPDAEAEGAGAAADAPDMQEEPPRVSRPQRRSRRGGAKSGTQVLNIAELVEEGSGGAGQPRASRRAGCASPATSASTAAGNSPAGAQPPSPSAAQGAAAGGGPRGEEVPAGAGAGGAGQGLGAAGVWPAAAPEQVLHLAIALPLPAWAPFLTLQPAVAEVFQPQGAARMFQGQEAAFLALQPAAAADALQPPAAAHMAQGQEAPVMTLPPAAADALQAAADALQPAAAGNVLQPQDLAAMLLEAMPDHYDD